MIELVYSPVWFYGKDIVIDAVSIFVLSLIAAFSIRFNKLRKNRNNLILATSFLLMAVSFLFKITTNFSIYYHVLETQQIGLITYTYNTVRYSDIIFDIGYLMYRILMLFGLYVLYLIYSKTDKVNIFIVSYLIIISTYFSRSAYYIFHITSLIFLLLITAQYYRNYLNTRQSANKWLALSFLLITISQFVFCFVSLIAVFYVIAEITQLLGYLALLMTLIRVLKDGKKKGKK